MEYANREQAQQAINDLSNKTLMGRMVYVREVSLAPSHKFQKQHTLSSQQDRETEPRFQNSAPNPRGGYDGGFGGRGGFQGGPGMMGGGAGRQIFVSNVCIHLFH